MAAHAEPSPTAAAPTASAASTASDTPHTPREPAPGDLALVQAFVNTLDIEEQADELTDLNALRRWFVSHRLLGPREQLRDGDVQRAAVVREALRDVLASHNGAPPNRAAVSLLNKAAASAPMVVALDGDGRATLAPGGRGLDAALARLFAIVQQSTLDGTWQRLKACPDPACRYVFYDRSRNRSGTWCAMRVCGNRAKARAFRQRHAG